MNSEHKNYFMKEFWVFFLISILVIRSLYAKQCHFQYKLYFKMYMIYINLGCRFEFRTQKLPYQRILGSFLISSILVIRSSYAKQGNFSILAVFQKVWDLHKFGLQIWIQNAKITLLKNFEQFFQLHRFWSSGMRNKVSFQY